MSYSLVSAILGQKWLISPEFAQANLGLVFSILKGESNLLDENSLEKASKKFEGISAGIYGPRRDPYTGKLLFLEGEVEKGSTAMIPVMGAMMKYDGMCGELGSKTLTELTKKADAHPNIKNILYIVDGPGGMVAGTQTFADAIKASQKPTYGFVDDGMACSAHYWILASCDVVWSSHITNTIGSIGVYTQLANWKKYYGKEGLDIHEVYASQSSEKNKDYKDALEGNYKSLKEGHLDPIAAIFIEHVTTRRAGKLNLEAGDPMKGGAYTSDIAMSIGLIDRIGSLQELLEEMKSSSTSTPNQNSNQISQSNNNQMDLKKWFASNKAGENDGKEKVTIEASELNELRTDMEAAQTELDTANASNEQLTAQLATANTSLTEATSNLEAANAEVATLKAANTELEAQVKELGAKPGATHNVPKKGAEDLGEDVISESEQFEAYAHNKEAMNELKNI